MKFLAAITFLILLGGSLAADEPELCGTCWCIDGSSGANCPAFEPGHYEKFDPALTEVLDSLVPAGTGVEGFKLQAEDGSAECNPFYHLEPNEKVPKSDLPPCVPPPMAGTKVGVNCAMSFPGGPLNTASECCGRTYELVDFLSAVGSDDAVLTHTGHCGVCSTAKDLAVIGSKVAKSGRALDTQSITCTSIYVVNVNTLSKDPNAEFDNLVTCFTEEVGYSTECAKLWAHSAATTSVLCIEACSGLGAAYNGPAPECELSECIKCSDNAQGDQFAMFAGRTNTNSGITQPIARMCDEFSSLDHEAVCGDALPEGGTCTTGGSGGSTGGGGDETPGTPDDTDDPTSSAFEIGNHTRMMVFVMAAIGGLFALA